MGGINHQPTTNVSLAHTVPGARALTRANAELMLGNCEVESAIMYTGDTTFGAGRGHLEMAASHFGNAATQLNICKSHVSKVIDALGSSDYKPFDLSTVGDGDLESFVHALQVAQLLPNSMTALDAAVVARTEGYRGLFFVISEKIDAAQRVVNTLHATTKNAVEGPEGYQGYFWHFVETGQSTWRQDFMRAMTGMDELLVFWATSACFCTEVHLLNSCNGMSLLEGAQMST